MIDPMMIRRAFGEYREGDAQALTREDCKGSTLWKTRRAYRRKIQSDDARRVIANDLERCKKERAR